MDFTEDFIAQQASIGVQGTQGGFICVPNFLIDDKRLTMLEKLMYCKIASFDEFWGSNDWLAQFFGRDKRTIIRALNKLEECGYIARKRAVGSYRLIRVERDAEKLRAGGVTKLAGGGDKNVTGGDKNVTLGVTKMSPKNKSIKEKYNELDKSNSLAQAPLNESAVADRRSPDIEALMSYWEASVGVPAKRDKRNRQACYTLFRKYHREGVEQLIRGVALAKDDRYAPRIASFTQLREKLPDLILWGQKRQNGGALSAQKPLKDDDILEGF